MDQFWVWPAAILGLILLVLVIVKLCGVEPRDAAALMGRAMQSPDFWGEVARRSAVLGLCGLSVVLSFRAGLFNIGAEGQLLAGAIAATAVATKIFGSETPWFVGMPLMVLAGCAAGACWSLLAGVLRVWKSVSEVISTLMLNLIAIWLLRYVVSYPQLLQEPGSNFSQGAPFVESLRFSRWGGTPFHTGVLLVPLILAAAQVFLFMTRGGLALRATGLNPVAARACGIRTLRLGLLTFGAAGALAGCAGAMGVMAQGYLPHALFPDYGYMAIAVALVAFLHPLAVLPSALFFGFLETAASTTQTAGVPNEVLFAIQGLVIVALLCRGVRLPGTKREDAPA